MTYRVALWGTGWAGRQAIPGILEHPDLELAGTYVTSPDKDGRDVGELAGISPIGLLATSDADRIMDLGVDCHLVMLLGHRPRTVAAVVDRICAILEAGPQSCRFTIRSTPPLRCASRWRRRVGVAARGVTEPGCFQAS